MNKSKANEQLLVKIKDIGHKTKNLVKNPYEIFLNVFVNGTKVTCLIT